MHGTGKRPRRIAVIGPGAATPVEQERAREVGRRLAEAGAVLLCGGLGGCMEAAARGALEAGGTTLGFLPGYDPGAANESILIPLPTGMGEARNVLVVAGAEAVIAVGGQAGTLSEIALALKLERRVIALGSWEVRDPDGQEPAIVRVGTAEEAVRAALQESA